MEALSRALERFETRHKGITRAMPGELTEVVHAYPGLFAVSDECAQERESLPHPDVDERVIGLHLGDAAVDDRGDRQGRHSWHIAEGAHRLLASLFTWWERRVGEVERTPRQLEHACSLAALSGDQKTPVTTW